jgi:hypothetical protein
LGVVLRLNVLFYSFKISRIKDLSLILIEDEDVLKAQVGINGKFVSTHEILTLYHLLKSEIFLTECEKAFLFIPLEILIFVIELKEASLVDLYTLVSMHLVNLGLQSNQCHAFSLFPFHPFKSIGLLSRP